MAGGLGSPIPASSAPILSATRGQSPDEGDPRRKVSQQEPDLHEVPSTDLFQDQEEPDEERGGFPEETLEDSPPSSRCSGGSPDGSCEFKKQPYRRAPLVNPAVRLQSPLFQRSDRQLAGSSCAGEEVLLPADPDSVYPTSSPSEIMLAPARRGGYEYPSLSSHPWAGGGIGRHVRLRGVCRKAWGFKSPPEHF